MTLIYAVLVGLALVVAAVGVVLAKRRRKAIDALPAEHKHWYESMRSALVAFKKEKSAHEKSVRGARRALEQARQPRQIGSEAGFTLFDTELRVSGRIIHYSPALHARVEATGNTAVSSRTTATRVGAGALVAGPVGAVVGAVAKKNKVIDAKELYLLLEDVEWAEVVTCKSERGQQVRSLAQQVNLAAGRVEDARMLRKQEVVKAKSELALTEANTTGLMDARAVAIEMHERRPVSESLDRLLPAARSARTLSIEAAASDSEGFD